MRMMAASGERSHRLFPRSSLITFAMVLALGTVGCSSSKSHTSGWTAAAMDSNYQPQPYHGSLESDDGQWTRPAKDYASTRYSTLNEINTGNVKNLKLSFTFSTGTDRGLEAAPIVVNNTMYVV